MAETNISKNREGYGYKYTDLAQIHEYLEKNNMRYYQYVETVNGNDYIMTVPIIDGKEQAPRRGVKIVDAVLNGIKNPAQEQGSAITYARRYSLLMAFGLATEDDDGASLTKTSSNKNTNKNPANKNVTNNASNKITEEQSKEVYALMTQKGLNVVETLKKYFNISNTKDLNISQYETIVNTLKKQPDKK